MSAPPVWATALLARVAADEGRTDMPTLVWRRSGKTRRHWSLTGITYVRPQYSSGHWKRTARVIVVTAGSSRIDQRLVLLHEAAHWLAPEEAAHSNEFWVIAFRLFRQYKVPMAYAKRRSLNYRAKAKAGIAADRQRTRAA